VSADGNSSTKICQFLKGRYLMATFIAVGWSTGFCAFNATPATSSKAHCGDAVSQSMACQQARKELCSICQVMTRLAAAASASANRSSSSRKSSRQLPMCSLISLQASSFFNIVAMGLVGNFLRNRLQAIWCHKPQNTILTKHQASPGHSRPLTRSLSSVKQRGFHPTQVGIMRWF
jgi:hypothetical protein